MAKEADQTRWVGVRPTDPSEDIPTTTKKVLPAVADLQAIKANISKYKKHTNMDCRVSLYSNSLTVGAGEIWIINNVVMWDEMTRCDMAVEIEVDGAALDFIKFDSYEPFIQAHWSGMTILEENDRLRFHWTNGGIADTIWACYSGYIIGVY